MKTPVRRTAALSPWWIPALLMTAFLVSGCGSAERGSSVIIISVDTLRADHVSALGYERETTPNIDKLFEKSAVFTNAIVPRPKTTPSMVSMMTGLYPARHGVHRLLQPLRADITTLAEVLKEHDYRTAAFVSNYVLISELSGLDQGFDLYDDFVTERELNRDFYERHAEESIGLALEWLRANHREPFFLWIHLQDPHGPYRPPSPYDEKFRSSETNEIAPKLIPAYQRLGDLTDANRYIDYYDGEIRYLDKHVGTLIDEISRLNIADDTLVVFTADHGESLGEHRYYFDHGARVYDATVSVPLSLSLPAVMPAARISQQASLIDLFPTVLDLLRIENSYGSDGESLLPVVRGESEHAPYGFIEGFKGLRAVRTEEWKLIFTLDGQRRVVRKELYDLAADPGEARNIILSKSAVAARLEKPLLDWIAREPKDDHRDKDYLGENWVYGPKKRPLSDDMRQRLRSLGYVR